jgi:hypothetical protein
MVCYRVSDPSKNTHLCWSIRGTSSYGKLLFLILSCGKNPKEAVLRNQSDMSPQESMVKMESWGKLWLIIDNLSYDQTTGIAISQILYSFPKTDTFFYSYLVRILFSTVIWSEYYFHMWTDHMIIFTCGLITWLFSHVDWSHDNSYMWTD